MVLHVCPFKYKRFNPDTGYSAPGASKKKDDYNRKVCNLGKGPWCENCGTYSQSKTSDRKWKKMYETMGKTGIAPHLRKKVNPERIINPFSEPIGLRARNIRRL